MLGNDVRGMVAFNILPERVAGRNGVSAASTTSIPCVVKEMARMSCGLMGMAIFEVKRRLQVVPSHRFPRSVKGPFSAWMLYHMPFQHFCFDKFVRKVSLDEVFLPTPLRQLLMNPKPAL